MKKPNMTREQWEATTPPVNESWREKYHKILNDNSNRPLFNDLERFIERQLFTARQEAILEERERLGKLNGTFDWYMAGCEDTRTKLQEMK